MTQHIIWLAGVPHNTSVLYAVGPPCPGTCNAVNKGCVVGPAEVDMREHIIWLGKMLHDTAVSAVCRWTWSPLNVMLSRVGLMDSLEETLHPALRHFASVWRDTVITHSVSLNLLERTSDHIISAMQRQTWSHSELSMMPWDGCVRKSYVSLHSLGEHTSDSSVLCTIGLAERTCDVVWRRSSLCRQHYHHVYAMAKLLSPPHWYVIGLSQLFISV